MQVLHLLAISQLKVLILVRDEVEVYLGAWRLLLPSEDTLRWLVVLVSIFELLDRLIDLPLNVIHEFCEDFDLLI